MKKYYCSYIFDDRIEYVIFNHKGRIKIYLLDKIYAVRIENNEIYFADANMIKEYLKNGYIYNVYDKFETHYSDKPLIYSITSFREFTEDKLINFIDVYENKIYVNTGSLDYKLYDIEESEKVLIK